MGNTDLNGIPDKVQKTEQIFIWFIQSVWRGTWFRRLVFLFILFLTFASPTFVTYALSAWALQIPTWYGRSYWIAAGLLALLTLTVGLRTLPRLPGGAQPRIDVHAARGLVPFNLEDSELFAQLERGIALQRVLAALLDPSFRFGILTGLSGTGKTSFLRAGLLAQLRKSNVPALYVELSNEDPLASIQREASRQGQRVVEGVLFLDQFEQFFLHQHTDVQRRPLIEALARWYQRGSGVRVLISIRAEDLWRMKEIQDAVDYELTNQNYFKLSKFSSEQAAKVLQVLCISAGITFDPAFVSKIVDSHLRDLEDSLVSPVNLGILIHVLATTQGVRPLTRETFRAYGGIDGLLEDWLNSQLEAAKLKGLQKAVIRTLGALCDFDRNRRSGNLTGETITACLAGDFTREEVDRALDWLEQPLVRLVIRIDEERAKASSYQLTHERLIQAVRKAAGKLLDEAARANELLDRRVREWISNERSSRFLLPLLEYWRVERQRPYLIWGDARADKESLLKKSLRRSQRRAAYSALGIVVLLSAYPIWTSKRVQRYYIKKDLERVSISRPRPDAVRALALVGAWSTAVSVADNLPSRRESALRDVAAQMAKAGLTCKDNRLVEQALQVGAKLDSGERWRVLLDIGVIIAARNAGKSSELLNQAREMVGKLSPSDRSKALGTIAIRAAKVGDPSNTKELLREAKEQTNTLDASHRTENLLEFAITTAAGDDSSSAKDLLGEALKAAYEISPDNRSGWLSRIATEMAEIGLSSGDQNLVDRALQVTKRVDLSSERERITEEIAEAGLMHNNLDLVWQAQREANELSESDRAVALGRIALAMADAGLINNDRSLVDRALQLAKSVDSPGLQGDREQIVVDVAKAGLAHNDQDLVNQAEREAKELHESRSYEALADIAVALAKVGRHKEAKSLLKEAQAAGIAWSENGQGKRRTSNSFWLVSLAEDMFKVGIMTGDEKLKGEAVQMTDQMTRAVARQRTKKRIVEFMVESGHLKQARELAETESGSAKVDAIAAIVLADKEVHVSCP